MSGNPGNTLACSAEDYAEFLTVMSYYSDWDKRSHSVGGDPPHAKRKQNRPTDPRYGYTYSCQADRRLRLNDAPSPKATDPGFLPTLIIFILQMWIDDVEELKKWVAEAVQTTPDILLPESNTTFDDAVHLKATDSSFLPDLIMSVARLQSDGILALKIFVARAVRLGPKVLPDELVESLQVDAFASLFES